MALMNPHLSIIRRFAAEMGCRLMVVATQIMVMAMVITLVLILLGAGALVLLHFSILLRALRGGFSASSRRGGGEGFSEKKTGLSPGDLQRLPCYDFRAGADAVEVGRNPTDCAICLESFQVGDKCRLLPVCKHWFHAHCVDSWLLTTPSCPICRSCAGEQKSLGSMAAWEEQRSLNSGVGFEFRENENPSALVSNVTER